MAATEELEAMTVRLFGDTTQYQQAMDEAEKETEETASAVEEFGHKIESIGGVMSSVGKKMSLAITAPLSAFKAYSLMVFSAQEKAEVTLKGLLDAMGKPTGLFQDYKDFASHLQTITTTGDETTLEMLKMAEALGVSGEAAKTAIKEAMGLASAVGMNAQSAARYTAMLAMGETSMLARYLPGLRMIEDKAEQVAYAHEQLANMFAVAESEAGTFGGMLVRMWNEFGDFGEEVGRVLAAELRPFVEWLKDTLEWAKQLPPGYFKIGVAIGAIAAAVGPVLIAAGTLVTMFGGLIAALPFVVAGFAALPGILAAWAPPILVVVGLLAGLVTAVILFRDQLWSLIVWVKDKFMDLIKPFEATIQGIKNALQGGDLQLAWEILWTQVKLKFLEVTRDIRKGWALFQRDISRALGANLLAFGFIDQQTYDNMVQDATTAVSKIDEQIQGLREELELLNSEAAGVAKGFGVYEPDMGSGEDGEPVVSQYESLEAGAVEAIGRGTLKETILAQESRLAFIERGPSMEQQDSENIKKTADNTQRIAESQEALADRIFPVDSLDTADFKG
jgi:hypothetical protein